MKISAKIASFLGVLLLILGVFYAQTESMRSNQNNVDLVKSIKAI